METIPKIGKEIADFWLDLILDQYEKEGGMGINDSVKMNLYLISQEVNNGYDTYDSAVVAAVSEEAARSIHPGKKDWDGKAEQYGTWCAKENVSVRLIGTAADDVTGVIFAWFNAG